MNELSIWFTSLTGGVFLQVVWKEEADRKIKPKIHLWLNRDHLENIYWQNFPDNEELKVYSSAWSSWLLEFTIQIILFGNCKPTSGKILIKISVTLSSGDVKIKKHTLMIEIFCQGKHKYFHLDIQHSWKVLAKGPYLFQKD